MFYMIIFSLFEKTLKNAIFHICNIINIIQYIKSFFKISSCACPTTAVCNPDKIETLNVF